MKTNEIVELLNNPKVNEINMLKPTANKVVYDMDNNILRYDLNGEYMFNFCSSILDRNNLFWEDTSSFDKVHVPMCVEFSGYGQLQYVNTQYPWDGREDISINQSVMKMNYCSQYVKRFQINKEQLNKYILSFEGVESCFNVWLNGKHIGYNEDSFTTSSFDVSNMLVDGENTLAIEVYKYNVGSWLNDQDFWRLSGIFRSVYLEIQTPFSIIDYTLTYDLDLNAKVATVNLEFERNNEFEVEYILKDASSKVMGICQSTVSFQVDNIKLWSSENPYLYELIIKTPQEQFSKKIGFRKVHLSDNSIYFNGKKLHIKGVNRHEFNSLTGRVQTYEQIVADLKLLKEMNVNSIRTSHYPNCNMLYDLCDEYGFMVMDETNLETHGTWMVDGKLKIRDAILPADNIDFEKRVLDRAKNMFYRDRNNTCVIFWSLGNESYGGKTLRKMNNFFKANDTRLVHYEGVFWDRSDKLISDIESQMYTSSEDVEKFIKVNNEKPFILCEYSHAMGNSNGNLEDYLELFNKYPNYHGGYIWEFTEQLIFKNNKYNYGGDFGDRPTDGQFICDGIVSDYERDTPEKKYIANIFSPIKVIENKDNIILENESMNDEFKDLRLDIIQTKKSGNILLTTRHFDLENEFEIPKINNIDNVIYKIYQSERLLKEFSVNKNIKRNLEVETQKSKNNNFVDGDNNFGIINDEFEILFSKVKNNIISLKYYGSEVFNNIFDSFEPNFYRALTNNDIGCGKDMELGVLKYISYNYQTKITNYEYKNEILYVQIEFTNKVIEKYKSVLEYQISQIGEIKLTLTVHELPTPYAFNIGLKTNLAEKFINCIYLGRGSYDTYSDRKKDVVKGYFKEPIDKKIPYIYPQEYGNRVDTDEINILDQDNHGLKIEADLCEFSIRNYTDLELDEKVNVSELKKTSPFLRINKSQTGVGGDDSWKSWSKEKNIAKIDTPFIIKISKY